MTDRTEPDGATTRSYEEKYDRFGSRSAAEARIATLGSELPNGYTTRAQAALIASELGLDEEGFLLDLGSGRGWPGSYVAEVTGCRLLAADLPMNALVQARETLAPGLSRAAVVCADGRRLPLGDGLFDAVCHADVLC